MSRFAAVDTVTNENMAVVWTTSPYLPVFPLEEFAGCNSAVIHRKNRMTTIPNMIADKVDTDRQMYRLVYHEIPR